MKAHDRKSTDTLAAGAYAPLEVDDPYERGGRITVMRQTRGDPLARLHAHGQIDQAQYNAGRAFQRDWETAERGARAIDPTKEAVDGGRIPEPLTDNQAQAKTRLINVQKELGRRLSKVLEAVLIHGLTMEQIAQSRAQSLIKLQGNLLRTALNELAIIYGLSSAKRQYATQAVAVQQITL